MQFTFHDALPVLQRTPAVLRAWLIDLPDSWTYSRKGTDTWSPYDVVGHLIHGERTDWIPRVRHILQHREAIAFAPFDRNAMLKDSQAFTMAELLTQFDRLRAESLRQLRDLNLTDRDLAMQGMHPELGRVTLSQLLATWVAHDLNHISQIARTMAYQYRDTVGPWTAYLSVLRPMATH